MQRRRFQNGGREDRNSVDEIVALRATSDGDRDALTAAAAGGGGGEVVLLKEKRLHASICTRHVHITCPRASTSLLSIPCTLSPSLALQLTNPFHRT